MINKKYIYLKNIVMIFLYIDIEQYNNYKYQNKFR